MLCLDVDTHNIHYASRDDLTYNSLKIQILYYDCKNHIPGFFKLSTMFGECILENNISIPW